MLALRGVPPEAGPPSPPSRELMLPPWLTRRGLLTELQLPVRPGLRSVATDPLSVLVSLALPSAELAAPAWPAWGNTTSSTTLAVTTLPLETSPLPLERKRPSCEDCSAAMVMFCESFCPLVLGLGRTRGGTVLPDGDSGEVTRMGDFTGEVGLSPDFFLSWLNNCNRFWHS